MPRHRHVQIEQRFGDLNLQAGGNIIWTVCAGGPELNTEYTGSSASHSVLNAYQGIYGWERID